MTRYLAQPGTGPAVCRHTTAAGARTCAYNRNYPAKAGLACGSNTITGYWRVVDTEANDDAEANIPGDQLVTVQVRADVLEVVRRYAGPQETDGDAIARMVWAATRSGR